MMPIIKRQWRSKYNSVCKIGKLDVWSNPDFWIGDLVLLFTK